MSQGCRNMVLGDVLGKEHSIYRKIAPVQRTLYFGSSYAFGSARRPAF